MRFVLTAAEEARRQATQTPPAIIQPAVPVATYESIKAKIDNGISKLTAGRKEVAEGIKEMIETEAYTKKYKTIAAFAEGEYGKSARWISHMLESLIPKSKVNKAESADPPISTDSTTATTSENLNTTAAQSSNGSSNAQTDAAEALEEVLKDATDFPIPKPLIPTWERRDQVQQLMTLATKLKCAIETIYEKSDPLFRGGALNSQAHVASLNAIHYQLSQCKPGVVCPECAGTFKDDMGRECKVCRLTGFISESEWHHKYEKSNASFIKAKVEARNGSARLPA